MADATLAAIKNGDDARSSFSSFYAEAPFVDRFAAAPANAVDVIIPIIHTNELWQANLLSIYREIPVNRLILADGGCIDGSIDIARTFPRVEVLDHRAFKSLGYSIRSLIEAVQTEWFIYLHSDIFLPPGWFNIMSAHCSDYDWFECNQRITVLADYLLDTTKIDRSYSGSQMGRKAAFSQAISTIDDDYLYRNEDIIIAKLITRAGFKYGKVGETYHFHQIMHKPSKWQRAINSIDIKLQISRDEDIRANRTYACGIIKYLKPAEVTPDLTRSVRMAVSRLIDLQDTTFVEFRDWVRSNHPAWMPVFAQPLSSRQERNADRLIQLAECYRHFGAVATFSIVARGIGRILYMRGEGYFLGGAGGFAKVLGTYRSEGFRATLRLFFVRRDSGS